ncbi:hypothetical protein L1787_15410 [Acuticoccus sp. M5D2P5]|uniref:cytochrome c oxidase subunit II n=1 Tax=Acuticoccus kalidii TaxID=2910977 RepID=UPI001F34C7A1|nr:hypothetical protein [Acuticoccus kalidii]MCF3934790.1 hypothetical protein [Acuticoccus kalidii]
MSTVDPAGPAARTIAQIWWVMLIGAAAIFALVMGLLFVAYRPARNLAHASERVFLVGLGLAFPMIVLTALLGYGLAAGEQLLPKGEPEVFYVTADAGRWAWRFGYPGVAEGYRVSEDVLHIPAGRPVDVAITTRDVIHSFWVPRLAGKLDAVPGYVNVLRIEADAPGRYAGLSSEFSGPGYTQFGFEVIAHGAEDWQAFLAGELE